jgi:peptidoglycan/xylan/chitin deacetylase (PgdA/CDA1 family)
MSQRKKIAKNNLIKTNIHYRYLGLVVTMLLLIFGITAKAANNVPSCNMPNDKFTEYTTSHESFAPYLTPGKLTIIVSFDGSKSLDFWHDILAFSKENKMKATFFASGVYFLADQDKNQYKLPYNMAKKGISEIGFGGTSDDIKQRIAIVKQALDENHDIESHLNGHFDGSKWSQNSWCNEFLEFDNLTNFIPQSKHVRFPLLAMNSNVYPVMAKFGYQSVTSVIYSDYSLIHKINFKYDGKDYSIIEYPIPYVHDDTYATILMDYNLYYEDTHRKVSKTPEEIRKNTYKLYMDMAKEAYDEKRPLFFSHHFSEWEHAAYLEAMKDAIIDLRKKYDVEFLTISELTNRIINKN